MNEDRTGFGSDVVAVGVGVLVAAATVVGGGAILAAATRGRWLSPGAYDVLEATLTLPAHTSDPRAAWPPSARTELPGPVVYWSATGLVAAFLIAVVVLVWHRWPRRVGPQRARPFGVDTNTRRARPRDLTPLVVRGATRGRFLLGRVQRRLVATEDRTQPARGGARRNDRGAVCVIGPSRSGKTAALISGVLEWPGPAVLSSVKSDLLGATGTWRARIGEVTVFDPMATTGRPATGGWSPVGTAIDPTYAQRVARALADAAPRSGAEHLDFFVNLAEALLWPLLLIAHHGERSMVDVVRWTLVQDQPHPGSPGEVLATLERALATAPDPLVAGLHHARRTLEATWSMDDRTRSSVYATAQTLIRPWSDPLVARSAEHHSIEFDRLVAGNNTLYCCAPLHDQDRLAPVFGGLLGDLLAQAYARAGRGDTFEPLLIVLDEAANTPTRWLPQVASTCSGIGIVLVTVWQSKAQIDAAYGPLADSVLTNHLTKIIYAGVSDLTTGEYVSRLVGDNDVRHHSLSFASDRAAQLGEDTRSEALLPAAALRRLPPGHALLVHGTLPPAHMRAIPYYQDRRLAARARTTHPGATS